MVPTEMEDAHPTFRIFFGANSEKPMDFGEKKRIFRQTLQMDVNGSSTLQIWWFVFNTPIRCMGIWIELKHAQRWLNNVKYLFDSFLVYLSINNSANIWETWGSSTNAQGMNLHRYEAYLMRIKPLLQAANLGCS